MFYEWWLVLACLYADHLNFTWSPGRHLISEKPLWDTVTSPVDTNSLRKGNGAVNVFLLHCLEWHTPSRWSRKSCHTGWQTSLVSFSPEMTNNSHSAELNSHTRLRCTPMLSHKSKPIGICHTCLYKKFYILASALFSKEKCIAWALCFQSSRDFLIM